MDQTIRDGEPVGMTEVRCQCGAVMPEPVKTALGNLEYKCTQCPRSIIRNVERQERVRTQFGVGRRVLRWI